MVSPRLLENVRNLPIVVVQEQMEIVRGIAISHVEVYFQTGDDPLQRRSALLCERIG